VLAGVGGRPAALDAQVGGRAVLAPDDVTVPLREAVGYSDVKEADVRDRVDSLDIIPIE
jgi:hypothetical protein